MATAHYNWKRNQKCKKKWGQSLHMKAVCFSSCPKDKSHLREMVMLT